MNSNSRVFLFFALIGMFWILWLTPLTGQQVRALSVLPAVIIDDFEDGDVSDWGFFGGNAAGGGGGVLDDRPLEGAYYLSTGWGGEGSNSVFYGGFFKNFVDTLQIAPPTDPWFNVWVLNQSDATVDQYTLEITIREDLDGNGWTDGAEDSFRLDTSFINTSFDDQWTLISAPVSSFTNLSTGGNGTFDGNLDEVVIVVAGVQGGSGSTVEIDFDQLSFTSGGPLVRSVTVFDDMEHGDPSGNGWFTFGGAVGGGGINANNVDLPPSDGGAYSLETGWGSGGTPGFYGGFGRTNLTDLAGIAYFNFWINPDAGQDYTLEINLQEDDNGDDAAAGNDDDEFQYNCVVSPTGPCATSGGGWQQISIPLADFFDDNSFLTGGNGVLDAVPTSGGGNGQLINVVIAVIGNTGSDVNFRTDYWAFSTDSLATPMQIVDDFENGLPSGTDGDGVPIGFFTFSDGSPVSIATTDTPPDPVPGSTAGNNVMALTGNVTAFAGFIHNFENAAVDTWITQDWSRFEGLSFWLYGYNTGTTLFVDIIDNRNPGSTSDDAERFSVTLIDDFSGWQFFELPFSRFSRKEIGNGAPNDGFTLTQVHGWALGTLDTPGTVTYYIDDASLYGTAEIPELAVTFSAGRYDIEEGATGNITVKLNRSMNSDDPAQVSVDYFTEPGVATPDREYTPTSGTLIFVNGGPSELSFALETFDDTKWEGDERIVLRLANPVDVATGFATQSSAFIVENDPYDPDLLDDFTHGAYLWETSDDLTLETVELVAGDEAAIPGQDPFETVLQATSIGVAPRVVIEQARADVAALIPTGNKAADKMLRDALKFLDKVLDSHNWLNGYYLDAKKGKKVFGDLQKAVEKLTKAAKKSPASAPAIAAIIKDLVDASRELVRNAIKKSVPTAPTFGRDFAIQDDWSHGEALTFWYFGNNSGHDITVNLKDNRAPDPGPSGWSMVWSEEFNEPAGTPPNPEFWTYEIGDVTPDGKNGWGNDELQYYTDDLANAATDGLGNMVLTVRQDDGSRSCYYGPCEYTSARLISWRKAEFAYGRIESRILVPQGGGIWPAFWSLGTDIDLVSWPQTGEIDFMEFVGRLPNEIFGTIHGPGYSGGASFGNVYDFGEPVFNDYHTFAIEWEPDLIRWYVDDILYHTATPTDVAPNEWVFNDPVFLLLNVAIGGNFGGAVDPNISLPQSMAVDYIRVYQGPDTAERFEANFTDNFSGWQEVVLPFFAFMRSDEQPEGAPNDGLGLSEVWGYGFTLPNGGTIRLDQVRVQPVPPPMAVTVTTLADSGAGSLREALDIIAVDGVITFAPSLAGGTISLTSGQLSVDKSLSVDGSGAPGLTISGNNVSRVFQIAAGMTVDMSDLTISDGVGAPQGGGILNYGVLNLDTVTVTNNTESSAGPANFEFGGGGIYNGDGATLNLTNSTVSHNATLNQPGGGIYGFFNSTINVTNSTVSNNLSADVAGGLRTLGNASIVNSTISGNTSTTWHGGAMFMTDGTVTILNSTIVGNNAPPGTAGGLMVATFGAPVAVTVQNTIVASNTNLNCQIEGAPNVAILESLGNNVFTDGSCPSIGGDQNVVDAGVDVLAPNGGPTWTHALLPGSPAIDAGENAVCPATDQRGVARDTACDVGAFEATSATTAAASTTIEESNLGNNVGSTEKELRIDSTAIFLPIIQQ
ncbi:family 16 glycosylhydrolase [Chloroflexi bacterium TSY]|nr:family 16 glycosylhydrolase [Chloroflexi bacterium TSY]